MRSSRWFDLSFVTAALVVCLAVTAPHDAVAIEPSPGASASAPAGGLDATQAGGTLDGHIESIDYQSNSMSVAVTEGGVRKTYVVLVVAGTNIAGGKGFHTIADLKKGAHVQVLISRHGSTNTAQIIRLL